MVNLALVRGDSLDALESSGQTPIHHAASHAQYGDFPLRFYLEMGGNPNARNKEGKTPAHLLGIQGNLKSLLFLKTKGGDLYTRDLEGETPLSLLLEQEFLEPNFVLDKLVAQQVDVKAIRNKKNGNLLHILGERWSREPLSEKSEPFILNVIETAERLVKDFGVDINEKDQEGNTPLHYFAPTTHYTLLHVLIGLGADPHAINFSHETPGDRLLQKYFNFPDLAQEGGSEKLVYNRALPFVKELGLFPSKDGKALVWFLENGGEGIEDKVIKFIKSILQKDPLGTATGLISFLVSRGGKASAVIKRAIILEKEGELPFLIPLYGESPTSPIRASQILQTKGIRTPF